MVLPAPSVIGDMVAMTQGCVNVVLGSGSRLSCGRGHAGTLDTP